MAKARLTEPGFLFLLLLLLFNFAFLILHF